jgi:uncharacterized glyoxalase superfamily protein PhnB
VEAIERSSTVLGGVGSGTPTMPERSPNIFPALRYRDAAAAIDWLVDVLGFEKQFVVPGEDGGIAHAQLTFGPGMIMLGSEGGGSDEYDRVAPPPGGSAIYVYLEDVDGHHERASAAGAEVVRELRDEDYGGRGYSVRDPEGNVWTFGSYYPER